MLDKILDWNNLCDAWERVADNRGAPGVDKVSIRRFRRRWEENLRRIQHLVWEQRYRSGRLRRVAIPKKSGGQRLLQIPNVGDRVLQRATLNVLEPVFEREFLSCSYGYRPGRGVRGAVEAILQYRDRKLTWVLDADIDDCFDSLDHSLLRTYLMEQVTDYRVMNLIDTWLKAGRRFRKPDRGIALGLPISPLLCNVYLHHLDWPLVRGRWALVRYADDFVVLCPTREHAERAYQVVGDILAGLRLRYEPTKTCITSFNEGFEYLGVRFQGNAYEFMWQQKRVEVRGPVPRWLWGYMPEGYE